MSTLVKPEIMSPAGYWPELNAAIEAGADAVYFGLTHFSARAKVGFTLSELPEVMQTLHRRGVKGYVTFNTLVFDHELAEASRTVAAIAAAAADSIIVQDVGMAQLAHKISPELAIHGSTQMSITSAEGIALAQQLGVSRVVLARELSLKEIAAIRAETDCELEMFVHGALCVSYSGQCFSSEAWGGRSANRGQCAQACRLPYELMVDGEKRPLADARYLLSPGDLYALQQMPEIVPLGISALKIEGRYKDANYVALTTQAYRRAVDEAWAGLPLSISRAEEQQLEQVYSRGLGAHFVAGTNHQTVVNGRFPRHRGLHLGTVVRVLPDRVVVAPQPDAPAFKPGDGIVFDAADWRSPSEAEEGGRIYHVLPQHNGTTVLTFGNNAVNFGRIRPGDRVWRTHDPDLDKVTKPLLQPAAPVHKQPVSVHLSARTGQSLTLRWTLNSHPHITTTVQSPEPLVAAQNQGLTADSAHKQLSRLGNTPYELTELVVEIEANPFVPNSLLNTLRRDAVEQLIIQQSQPPQHPIHDPITLLSHTLPPAPPPSRSPASPQLHLLVRTPEQLEAALAVRPASITLDYLDLYGLRPAVERVQASGIEVRVASPRILKPQEQRIVNFLRKLGCPLLVRSGGLLHALQPGNHPPLIGDFSLNAANALTAATLLQQRLTRLTPSHDLNGAQVVTLAEAIGAERLEVIAYHHLPVFHTEHCVFCRFLSTGTSYKDCGTPCETHRVALRDVHGRSHPVLADVGCRNTVFGAEAQEASRHLASWLAAGIVHFRLEFVHESADEVAQVGDLFRAALSGAMGLGELGNRLRQTAPQGTTEGSLYIPADYLTLPVLQ